MNLRMHYITRSSYVDGPGKRIVLYVQGCPIHCPGCQSPFLWNEQDGAEMDTEDVAAELLSARTPITISGGEPMAQAEAVADVLMRIRTQRPSEHVVVYSGYTLEDLLEMAQALPAIRDVLLLANVLVDGPFIQAQDDDFVQYRGSRNQRPIDLQRSLWIGDNGLEIGPGGLVILDWDTQVLTVTSAGDVVGTEGMITELFEESTPNRMCGQTEES